jgi:hypothetical protein
MKKRQKEKTIGNYPPGYLEHVYDLLYTFGYSAEDVEYATGLHVDGLNCFKHFANQIHQESDSRLTTFQICEEIERRRALLMIQAEVRKCFTD